MVRGYNCNVSPLMPVANCANCVLLFEKISHLTKKQLAAISAREEMAPKDAMDAEFSALTKQAEFWASERHRAMEVYRDHQRSHGIE